MTVKLSVVWPNLLNLTSFFQIWQLFLESLVRASDQNIFDRQGILMQILLVSGFNVVLFTSKHTVTNISVHRTSADERCSHRHSSPESTCACSRYRSRLDNFQMTRPRNSQQTIRGTVIRSKRGGTSTATKINVKQRDSKRFYTTTVFLTHLTISDIATNEVDIHTWRTRTTVQNSWFFRLSECCESCFRLSCWVLGTTQYMDHFM